MSDVSTHSSPEPQIAPVPADPQPAASVDRGHLATPVQTAATQSGDTCGSCGAPMASDQRYCLACGARGSDPRLPFMDAVVLMDAVKQPSQPPPPPPKKKRGGISPNAALIAGVGTLLLALGIGVLIGRSGNHEVAQTAAPAQVIKVGGGEEATSSSGKGAKTTTGGGKNTNLKTKKQKEEALKASENNPPSEEVLHTAPGVKTPPATVKPGDKCEKGTAGCENGEFTGNFFE